MSDIAATSAQQPGEQPAADATTVEQSQQPGEDTEGQQQQQQQQPNSPQQDQPPQSQQHPPLMAPQGMYAPHPYAHAPHWGGGDMHFVPQAHYQQPHYGPRGGQGRRPNRSPPPPGMAGAHKGGPMPQHQHPYAYAPYGWEGHAPQQFMHGPHPHHFMQHPHGRPSPPPQGHVFSPPPQGAAGPPPPPPHASPDHIGVPPGGFSPYGGPPPPFGYPAHGHPHAHPPHPGMMHPAYHHPHHHHSHMAMHAPYGHMQHMAHTEGEEGAPLQEAFQGMAIAEGGRGGGEHPPGPAVVSLPQPSATSASSSSSSSRRPPPSSAPPASSTSSSSSGVHHSPPPPAVDPSYGEALYKTELCKSFSESRYCRYGLKCRFAHGEADKREVQRHKKYKTERCKNYSAVGSCPYGPRCRFIHDEDEANANNTGNKEAAATSVTASVDSATQQQHQHHQQQQHSSQSFSPPPPHRSPLSPHSSPFVSNNPTVPKQQHAPPPARSLMGSSRPFHPSRGQHSNSGGGGGLTPGHFMRGRTTGDSEYPLQPQPMEPQRYMLPSAGMSYAHAHMRAPLPSPSPDSAALYQLDQQRANQPDHSQQQQQQQSADTAAPSAPSHPQRLGSDTDPVASMFAPAAVSRSPVIGPSAPGGSSSAASLSSSSGASKSGASPFFGGGISAAGGAGGLPGLNLGPNSGFEPPVAVTGGVVRSRSASSAALLHSEADPELPSSASARSSRMGGGATHSPPIGPARPSQSVLGGLNVLQLPGAVDVAGMSAASQVVSRSPVLLGLTPAVAVGVTSSPSAASSSSTGAAAGGLLPPSSSHTLAAPGASGVDGHDGGASSLFASPMHSPLIQPNGAPGSNKLGPNTQTQQQQTAVNAASLELLELGPNAFST